MPCEGYKDFEPIPCINCRTIDMSDYRYVGLSICRTIDRTPFKRQLYDEQLCKSLHKNTKKSK